MRRQQSRNSCDSDAFARPRARRALTELQGLDVRPCPTPPGPSAGSVAGSCAALVAVCCGRKVALFTLLHGGHVVWSNCGFSVLSGPLACSTTMFLYHVQTRLDGRRNCFRICTHSSTPDFALSATPPWFRRAAEHAHPSRGFLRLCTLLIITLQGPCVGR